MNKEILLEYIVQNNPFAVSERLGVIGITDGEYYEPEDLYAIITEQATLEMGLANGEPDAYWNTVADSVDVPVNVQGPTGGALLASPSRQVSPKIQNLKSVNLPKRKNQRKNEPYAPARKDTYYD